jgi:flagella basal body P-ring formation protein FlgA
LLILQLCQLDDGEPKLSVKTIRSLILLLVATLPCFAQASVHPLEDLQKAAEAFVRDQLPKGPGKHFVTSMHLDSRLRLEACQSPLETFANNAAAIGSRVTVGVRCTSGNQWTVYVPVKVETELPVLVLRRALPRGARIALGDVERQTRRLPGSASQFIGDIAKLEGYTLKRSAAVGTALTVNMLAPDLLVRRGQRVTLLAKTGAIEIRAQGEALSDGAVSERVRVQNLSSRKIVEGVVVSESLVRVGL